MRDPASRKGGVMGAVDGFLFPFDSLASKIHAVVFFRFRYASLAFALGLYVAVLLAFGEALGVSSNYFVILPVMVASLGFGAKGGLAAGSLALPANLLFFGVLGHPEYSPASKPIAELSGLCVGLVCGRLADYFRVLEREIKKRTAIEEALRAALAEKKLLLRELQHRVKNNLSVIKSLIQLQRNRSRDPAFLEAADELIGRIFAISLVHDQLQTDQALATVEIAKFIEALVANLAGGLGLEGGRIGLDLGADGRVIQMEAATSLGLIVNEVLTNALKHAASGCEGKPSIRLSFRIEGLASAGAEGIGEGDLYHLVICDDGPGPAAKLGAEASGGLGMKLVRALARNLGGKATLESIEGPAGSGDIVGARFELVFPSNFMELVSSCQDSPI
jgi:two-component sensor histidine kinase